MEGRSVGFLRLPPAGCWRQATALLGRFRVWDVGLRVYDLGFSVWDLTFRALELGLGSRVLDLGFRSWV